MNTVSLCIICKNEKSNIGLLLDDVCSVIEEVHITDTGSNDGTLEILAEKQKTYPNLFVHHFTWVDDFKEARNYSFKKAGDVDWIFWVDADDRVDPEALQHFKDNVLDDPNVDVWLMPYIYSKYPDGSPQTLLTRERFVRKSVNPTWLGAIHETIGIWHLRTANYAELKIEHNREGKLIDPKRNLNILEKEFKLNPKDTRTAYYYAKELFDHMDPKAKENLEHYLNLPGKYWDEEIGARFRLAKIYLANNNLREALLVIDMVYHLDGTRRRSEYYFIYGEVEFKLKNYEIAIDWYKRCLYTPPGPPRVLSLEYWTWHPLKKIAECYKELGDWENVFLYAKKVADILPGDVGTLSWLRELKGYRLEKKQGYSLVTLELGTTDLRYDSYKSGENFIVRNSNNIVSTVNWKLTKELPFVDNSIDGICLDLNNHPFITMAEVARVLKPSGFLWLKRHSLSVDFSMFNDLGVASYKDHNLINLVKIDKDKPVVGYASVLKSFAPFRYRIQNLILSLKKSGHQIIANPTHGSCDIFIGLTISSKIGKVNILEICEKLDDYSQFGVEYADVLNASSKLLAEHLRQLFPDKVVINIDDHYEMPNEGWL